jgi:tetratricopeptide (TPR) repeat protein
MHALFTSFLSSIVLVLVCASTTVVAQQTRTGRGVDATVTREARQHHREGVSAFAAGRYPEAIQAFLAADRLRPSPALSFNIAKAYEREGNTAEALQHYREYLHRAGQPQDRAAVAARIDELALRLGKTGVQQVSFRTEPAAAGVLVDAEPVGRSPVFVELRPGTHRVTFRQDGYEDAELEFDLNADQPLDVSITLVPTIERNIASTAVPAQPTSRIVRATRDHSRMASAAPQPMRTKSERRSRNNTTRTLGFVALGAGVAALGGAVTVEVMRRQAESEAKQEREQVRFARALDEMDSRQTLARVLAGAGGVFAAVGGVLVVTALGRDEKKPKEGLALNCAPKKCAATYSGAF